MDREVPGSSPGGTREGAVAQSVERWRQASRNEHVGMGSASGMAARSTDAAKENLLVVVSSDPLRAAKLIDLLLP